MSFDVKRALGTMTRGTYPFRDSVGVSSSAMVELCGQVKYAGVAVRVRTPDELRIRIRLTANQ